MKFAANSQKLFECLLTDAQRLGFADLGVVSVDGLGDIVPKMQEGLKQYIDHDYHGTMAWMKDTYERRSDPQILWPDVKSVIILTMNYGPEMDPLDNLSKKDCANISVYARHRDYHDVIKGRLKEIAARFSAKSGEDVKVFVDTAPVMEKPLAQEAGIGWQGKHTNLVSRKTGSWFFIASIFTTAQLDGNEPETDHCGSCRACLDVCPTKAFPQAYKIDARRCISYLTIEHKGPIAHEFRQLMGNRIYGCDDCLAVCPWNKYAQATRELKLQAREDLISPDLQYFLSLNDDAFRRLFSGSPVKRIGRDRFMRNVLIAAGNSQNTRLIPACETHLSDQSPIVRGAAIWALAQLLDYAKFKELYNHYLADDEASVVEEWQMAFKQFEQGSGVISQ